MLCSLLSSSSTPTCSPRKRHGTCCSKSFSSWVVFSADTSYVILGLVLLAGARDLAAEDGLRIVDPNPKVWFGDLIPAVDRAGVAEAGSRPLRGPVGVAVGVAENGFGRADHALLSVLRRIRRFCWLPRNCSRETHCAPSWTCEHSHSPKHKATVSK